MSYATGDPPGQSAGLELARELIDAAASVVENARGAVIGTEPREALLSALARETAFVAALENDRAAQDRLRGEAIALFERAAAYSLAERQGYEFAGGAGDAGGPLVVSVSALRAFTWPWPFSPASG